MWRTGGRVVPVYALTGGRTRSTTGADMPVETLVTVTPTGLRASELHLEYRATVELAATADLGRRDRGGAAGAGRRSQGAGQRPRRRRVPGRAPAADVQREGEGPAPEILERLLEGLRARSQ